MKEKKRERKREKKREKKRERKRKGWDGVLIHMPTDMYIHGRSFP